MRSLQRLQSGASPLSYSLLVLVDIKDDKCAIIDVHGNYGAVPDGTLTALIKGAKHLKDIGVQVPDSTREVAAAIQFLLKTKNKNAICDLCDSASGTNAVFRHIQTMEDVLFVKDCGIARKLWPADCPSHTKLMLMACDMLEESSCNSNADPITLDYLLHSIPMAIVKGMSAHSIEGVLRKYIIPMLQHCAKMYKTIQLGYATKCGRKNRTIRYYDKQYYIGCFEGNRAQAEKAINTDYSGDAAKAYIAKLQDCLENSIEVYPMFGEASNPSLNIAYMLNVNCKLSSVDVRGGAIAAYILGSLNIEDFLDLYGDSDYYDTMFDVIREEDMPVFEQYINNNWPVSTLLSMIDAYEDSLSENKLKFLTYILNNL